MSAQPEVFVAFEHPPVERDNVFQPKVEMAVQYDFAAEIDENNNWSDENSPKLDDAHEALVQASAKGLATLFQFAFEGVVLGSDGVGLQTAIRRFAAIAHFVDSNVLRGPHPDRVVISLNEWARQCRSTPAAMQKMARKFAQLWGFKVRIQKRRKGETAAD